MEDIKRFHTINQYFDYLGAQTLCPLVGVVDFSTLNRMSYTRYCFDFYTVFLKDVVCGDITYGKETYDYQEGTIVSIAPEQVFGLRDTGKKFQPKGWALVFDKELLKGTSLASNMKQYSFFSYNSHEALHLSQKEREIIMECLNNIGNELSQSSDQHSRKLIVKNIELFLDYCTRFYDRQFATREKANQGILIRFEQVLNEYFSSDAPSKDGLPSVALCASSLHLSPNYFGDLIKRETGITAQEHIQTKLIDVAKVRIFDTRRSVSEIAYSLGFRYPQHFSRLFKKQVGCTPSQYRDA